MKKILVTFSENGEVKVEAKGFSGKGCLSATKFVEEALGKKGDTKLTSDYYKSDNQISQEVDHS